MDINQEILDQLARQQYQSGNQLKIRIHPVPDEHFVRTYGNVRANITILIPENVHEKIKREHGEL